MADVEEPEAPEVPEAVMDAAVVALRRAGAAGLSKIDLQNAVGAGNADTRAVIAALYDDDAIEEGGEGLRWVDEDDRGRGTPIAAAASGVLALMTGDDLDAPDGAEEDADGAEDAGLAAAFGAPEPRAAPLRAVGDDEAGDGLGFTEEAARTAEGLAHQERFAATIAIEVQYAVHPEDGKTNDDIASEDADEMAAVVRQALERQYPGIVAAAYVAGIEVFVRSRKIR